MARIRSLYIEGFRSIRDPIELHFPKDQPLVLVGENNAGKSNIVKALELVLGPTWPGNYDPEDHDFFGRSRSSPIKIEIEFDPESPLGGRHRKLTWKYDPQADEPVSFYGWAHGRSAYVSNDDRDTCMCIVVAAERNLGYHLSYSSKWTFLSRLMKRFHSSLVRNEPVRRELEDMFHQVKAKFYEIPEFKSFVDDLTEQFEDLIVTMPHRLDIDFEAYNPVNYFHALRLQAAEGKEPRTLDEMGTGEQQVLALAFAYAYAKAFHGGIVLVVEEPESHLHPLAQVWLARRLREQCQSGLQLIITTHSPTFIAIEGLPGLVLVRKEDGRTVTCQISTDELVQRCIEMGAPEHRVTRENILPFYAANATTDLLSGFFARAVVLVEGPTEALVIPELFRKCGLDVEREGIAVLSVGGKGNLAKWYRLYAAYGIPTYVIFDNDSHDDKNCMKRADILRAVGVPDEMHSQLMETDEWIVDDKFTVFGQELEPCLRRYFPSYAKYEKDALQQGIDTKPFVARWAVKRLSRDEACTGWEKIECMVSRLRALFEGSRAPDRGKAG